MGGKGSIAIDFLWLLRQHLARRDSRAYFDHAISHFQQKYWEGQWWEQEEEEEVWHQFCATERALALIPLLLLELHACLVWYFT